MLIPILMTVLLGVPMVMAAISDLTSYSISNKICLAVMVGFFVIAPFASLSWAEFGIHILVGLGALIVMMGLFATGSLGGGDAKLYAATALWWMPSDLLIYTMFTALIGGVVALIIWFIRKFLPASVGMSEWAHHLIRDETKIPYGLALAPAAMLTLTKSSIFLGAIPL